MRWAPPYVADELRDAHPAEDACRAVAVHAWHRGDSAVDEGERVRVWAEAEQHTALAQEVGACREALAEVAGARRKWHAATEADPQRAVMADSELRRRHPDLELPQLRPEEDMAHPEAGDEQARDPQGGERDGTAALDIQAALEAAREAERIIAERELAAEHEADAERDDVMRRREAEARHEAAAHRGAVRQEPVPRRQAMALERDGPEPEGTASRSARAWAWALGETPIASVTDQRTAVPPGRGEIEAEIAEADERTFRGAPITRALGRELTSRVLKTERLHAQDVIDRARSPLAVGQRPSPSFGEGVKSAIAWLLRVRLGLQ